MVFVRGKVSLIHRRGEGVAVGSHSFHKDTLVVSRVAVEAVVLEIRDGVAVGFPHVARLITGIPKAVRQRRETFRDPGIECGVTFPVGEAVSRPPAGVAPGEKRVAGRLAHGGGHIEICEQGAFGAQSVERRSQHLGIVKPEVAEMLVVDENDNEIRPLGGGGRSRVPGA